MYSTILFSVSIFLLLIHLPPTPPRTATLFPYTTLFRSHAVHADALHVPGRDAPLMLARNGDGDAPVFQPVEIIARPCRGPAFRGEETPRLYDCGSGGVQVRYHGRSIQYAINHP